MDCLALRRSDQQVDEAKQVNQLKEDRLKTYGYVREEHGYDTTDPWLCDDPMEELQEMRPGSLVCVTGTELVCAYLGVSASNADFARLRDLRNLNVISLPFACLLPLPSRAPAPGEKAVFVGVDPELDGWPCSCGPRGHPWTGGAPAEVPGRWYWAVYTEPGAENILANKSMRLVHEANLMAFPGLPPGAAGTPLDTGSSVLLQPLAATAQEEQALLFARDVVREMIAGASEEPGVEVEALTDLVGSMRSAAQARNAFLTEAKPDKDEPKSNVVAMLTYGTADEMDVERQLEQEQRFRDKMYQMRRQRKFLRKRRASQVEGEVRKVAKLSTPDCAEASGTQVLAKVDPGSYDPAPLLAESTACQDSQRAPWPATQQPHDDTEVGKHSARDKPKESGIKARKKKKRKKDKKANKNKDEAKDLGDAQDSISDDIFERLMDVSVSSGDDEHFPEEDMKEETCSSAHAEGHELRTDIDAVVPEREEGPQEDAVRLSARVPVEALELFAPSAEKLLQNMLEALETQASAVPSASVQQLPETAGTVTKQTEHPGAHPDVAGEKDTTPAADAILEMAGDPDATPAAASTVPSASVQQLPETAGTVTKQTEQPGAHPDMAGEKDTTPAAEAIPEVAGERDATPAVSCKAAGAGGLVLEEIQAEARQLDEEKKHYLWDKSLCPPSAWQAQGSPSTSVSSNAPAKAQPVVAEEDASDAREDDGLASFLPPSDHAAWTKVNKNMHVGTKRFFFRLSAGVAGQVTFCQTNHDLDRAKRLAVAMCYQLMQGKTKEDILDFRCQFLQKWADKLGYTCRTYLVRPVIPDNDRSSKGQQASVMPSPSVEQRPHRKLRRMRFPGEDGSAHEPDGEPILKEKVTPTCGFPQRKFRRLRRHYKDTDKNGGTPMASPYRSGSDRREQRVVGHEARLELLSPSYVWESPFRHFGCWLRRAFKHKDEVVKSTGSIEYARDLQIKGTLAGRAKAAMNGTCQVLRCLGIEEARECVFGECDLSTLHRLMHLQLDSILRTTSTVQAKPTHTPSPSTIYFD
eukprot:s1355_g5.t1